MIERVPAGMEFDFQLVYNIEDENQMKEDMEVLCRGFRLLQLDYLGDMDPAVMAGLRFPRSMYRKWIRRQQKWKNRLHWHRSLRDQNYEA